MNCRILPTDVEGVAGATSMLERTAAVTVRPVEPEIEPEDAEMVVDPVAAVVARPFVPPAVLMLATFCTADVHVAEAVRSAVLPSE